MTTDRDTEVGIQPLQSIHPRRRGGSDAPALSQRRNGPRTADEAEERYVAARDAWTAAMRQAATGKPADLASLAIAQEAYEASAAEVERWRSGGRVPLRIDPKRGSIDAVVGQELAWRRVHEAESRARRGLLGRIARRLSGR